MTEKDFLPPAEVTNEKLARAANPLDEVLFTEAEAEALGAIPETAVSEEDVKASVDFDQLDQPI